MGHGRSASTGQRSRTRDADGERAARTAAILRLLGLARRAGQLRLGAHDVLRALRVERRGCVFLARDAGRDVRKRVQRAAGTCRLDTETFDGRTLAAGLGRSSLSVVSVHEPGFVRGLEQLLSD